MTYFSRQLNRCMVTCGAIVSTKLVDITSNGLVGVSNHCLANHGSLSDGDVGPTASSAAS